MASRQDIETYLFRIAQQDRAAHADLYQATSAKLFSVVLRVLSDTTDAEDALHDTYVKIWRFADRYTSSGHSPMTWLITIARNTAIDRLRARRVAEPYDDHAEFLADHGPTPEQAAVAGGERAQLHGCLDELPVDRRRAVTGAYLDGRTYAELAVEAAIPINTMRTWLRRSLIRLRECLEQ